MILVDTNLLIYSFIDTVPEHAKIRPWLEEQLNATPRVGLPWAALLSFVRLVSNPRIFEEPVALATAWRQVEEWLDLEPVWIPQPTKRHRMILGSVLEQAGGKANLVPDAHLAALAIEHGLTLCSADRDFARFSDLNGVNPLTEPRV